MRRAAPVHPDDPEWHLNVCSELLRHQLLHLQAAAHF